jgi:PAT family beta-lactamase induction signal transducer AmpG
MNNFFVIESRYFFGSHFASASNDVASDGFIYVSFRKNNNLFLGIRSTFYLSMLTGNGLIVIIGGYLEQEWR